MLTTTQRNPLKEAAIEAPKQHVCHATQALEVFVADRVPVWMNRVGIASIAGSSPRVQSARPQRPSVGSHVNQRLTDVKDALETDTEPAHLARILGFGSAQGTVQCVAVRGWERPIVCHHQSWTPKQTIPSLRPSPF
jgi:hypothetical protein